MKRRSDRKSSKNTADTAAAMEAFRERLKAQIGEEEFEAYIASCGEEPARGIRTNTGKISPEALEALLPGPGERVPWCREGFYQEGDARPSESPLYYAGLYYIQEPSAMIPAALLPAANGSRVLDLCAAPGGKSVALAAKCGPDGFLVSNDISAARARALLKNLENEGFDNYCVTAEEPARLRAAFGRCFDAVLVDAPCSGEGMFRRDPQLKKSWAQKGPSYYSPLQLEILLEAEKMLLPGGYLLYSTCTFSREENEEVIGAFLRQCPWMEIAEVRRTEGFSPGIGEGFENCVRLWPHKARGEGHFAALLVSRSKEDSAGAGAATSWFGEAAGSAQPPACVCTFFSQIKGQRWEDLCFYENGENLYVKRRDLPSGLRYLRSGLAAGTVREGRFEPSQALAMALRMEEYAYCLDLPADSDAALRYLRGETLTKDHLGEGLADFPSGAQVLVCCAGYPLGWAKAAGGSLKNRYPAGWRMQ